MNVESLLNDTAANYGVSVDAARAVWESLVRGNGSIAQFNHHELGGSGQWMADGTTTLGDISNYGLKLKVDGICKALSDAARAASQQFCADNNLNSNSPSEADQSAGNQTFEFSVGPSEPDSNLASASSSPSQSNFAASSLSQPSPVPAEASSTEPGANQSGEDLIGLLEKLGKLREAGILTDEEFSTKKAELLKRI